MRSISTEGGVEGRVLLGVSDELLLRWEGWEVVVIVNATGKWSFYTIVQTIFELVFRLTFCISKF